MCTSKFQGGLGFKSLAIFNMDLLAKQEWQIYHNKESLLHHIFLKKDISHIHPFLSPAWELILPFCGEGYGKQRGG